MQAGRSGPARKESLSEEGVSKPGPALGLVPGFLSSISNLTSLLTGTEGLQFTR